MKKEWLKNQTWKGLQLWGNINNPPKCKNGLKMRYVCNECSKVKNFKWPDLPKKWKQYDDGQILCKACKIYSPFFDPHTTGAAKFGF